MRHSILKASWWASVVLAVAAGLSSAFAAQEGIVLDPATGNYTITYQSDGGLSMTTFVPGGKVAPSIQSAFKVSECGTIAYRFTIANGKTAKQAIRNFYFDDIPHPLAGERQIAALSNPTEESLKNISGAELVAAGNANMRAMSAPPNWHNRIDPPGRMAHRVIWQADLQVSQGVPPSGKLFGFGFASPDLPGIMSARFKGLSSGIVYADEGPDDESDIAKQISQLIENDFVPRPAAVPTIAVPAPFDAAVLLDRIQTQTHTWIAMQLLDATFSSQLDRYLTAAADAYRHNQPKAGREDIETIHRMLMKEHSDLDQENDHADEKDRDKDAKRPLIDRLAARVLDFDLKYVLRRSEERKDKD